MSQINDGEGNVVSGHKVQVFALGANPESLELIQPSKDALGYQAMLVGLGVKQTRTAPLDPLAIVLVLSD